MENIDKEKEAAEALDEWTFLAITAPKLLGCQPFFLPRQPHQELKTTAKREKKHDE